MRTRLATEMVMLRRPTANSIMSPTTIARPSEFDASTPLMSNGCSQTPLFRILQSQCKESETGSGDFK